MTNTSCGNLDVHGAHEWENDVSFYRCTGIDAFADEWVPAAFKAAGRDATDAEVAHALQAISRTDVGPDPVNSPSHYTWLGGIEVIDITEHFSFTLGNVLKYVMRADHKGKPVEDLLKARYYLNRELKRRGHVDE